MISSVAGVLPFSFWAMPALLWNHQLDIVFVGSVLPRPTNISTTNRRWKNYGGRFDSEESDERRVTSIQSVLWSHWSFSTTDQRSYRFIPYRMRLSDNSITSNKHPKSSFTINQRRVGDVHGSSRGSWFIWAILEWVPVQSAPPVKSSTLVQRASSYIRS